MTAALPAVVLLVLLIVLSTRQAKWAEIAGWLLYGAYFLVSVLFIPSRAGFHLTAPDCEWTFGPRLAVLSFTNYAHIVLFICFFLMTYTQLRKTRRPMLWTFIVCLALGFLVEIEEGAAHFHHCRMRDLIPDTAGMVAGSILAWIAGRRHLLPSGGDDHGNVS